MALARCLSICSHAWVCAATYVCSVPVGVCLLYVLLQFQQHLGKVRDTGTTCSTTHEEQYDTAPHGTAQHVQHKQREHDPGHQLTWLAGDILHTEVQTRPHRCTCASPGWPAVLTCAVVVWVVCEAQHRPGIARHVCRHVEEVSLLRVHRAVGAGQQHLGGAQDASAQRTYNLEVSLLLDSSGGRYHCWNWLLTASPPARLA